MDRLTLRARAIGADMQRSGGSYELWNNKGTECICKNLNEVEGELEQWEKVTPRIATPTLPKKPVAFNPKFEIYCAKTGKQKNFDSLGILDQGLVLKALREEKADYRGLVEVDLEGGLYHAREVARKPKVDDLADMYVPGDVTFAFARRAKRTADLYQTGKLMIRCFLKIAPIEGPFQLFAGDNETKTFEVYWDNQMVADRMYTPREVGCVLVGLQYGLKIMETAAK